MMYISQHICCCLHTLCKPFGKFDSQESNEQPAVVPDVKHILLPSQMQKIANLVMILAQYRDFCNLLMEKSDLADQVRLN